MHPNPHPLTPDPCSPPPWSGLERAAWSPPEDLSVSAWAEKYRILPSYAQFPGPWSNDLAPYARGPMDAWNDPYVETVVIMASIQSVKTESAYNCLGYSICQAPAPALMVLPTHGMLKKANRRIRTMLRASEELSRHLPPSPDALTITHLNLDVMDIYFATAGSEADLQFVEARYLLLDETDLYPPGGVKMALDRATTYWNRKIIMMSRPTTPEGHINTEYARSNRQKYWVPCPWCGGYQVLEFGQLKHMGEPRGEWPRDRRDPEYIRRSRAARYECRHCQAEIDDQDKPRMLAGGKWVPEGHPIDRDGRMPPPPPVKQAGFWWSALYSPFKNFSEIMAEFFQVKDRAEDLRVFMNQWLAEPWTEIVQRREAPAILELCTHRPALELPDGVLGITAGIDNQKRGFWVSVWAWQLMRETRAMDQHLIRYGYLRYFEELEEWLFQDIYRNRDSSVELTVSYAAIDTGGGEGEPGEATQTDQIYQWLRRSGRGRVFGIKGASRPGPGAQKAWRSTGSKTPVIPGGLWILDTHALKEAFWSRTAEGRVHFHQGTGEDFAAQLTAEIKVREKGKEIWKNFGNRANHLLDTAIYATALAEPEWLNIIRWPVVQPQKPGTEEEAPGINPITRKQRGEYWRRG